MSVSEILYCICIYIYTFIFHGYNVFFLVEFVFQRNNIYIICHFIYQYIHELLLICLISHYIYINIFFIYMNCCTNNEQDVIFTSNFGQRNHDLQICIQGATGRFRNATAKYPAIQTDEPRLQHPSLENIFQVLYNCFLSWLIYIYIDIITCRQHIETFIYICTGQALANSFIAFCSQDQNLANRMQSACKFRTLRAQQSQDCFSCSPRLGWVPGTRLRPFSLSHVVQEFPIFHR